MTLVSTTHATCVVVGATGILIRGPSGAGKSQLGLALVEHARIAGRHAALVGDDRVELAASGGRLVARVPMAIAGLLEHRGRGIRSLAHIPSAVVRLVVDLVPARDLERMPEESALSEVVAGVRLPRQPVPERDVARALPLVQAALSGMSAPHRVGSHEF